MPLLHLDKAKVDKNPRTPLEIEIVCPWCTEHFLLLCLNVSVFFHRGGREHKVEEHWNTGLDRCKYLTFEHVL